MHGSCSEVYLEKAFDGSPCKPAQRLAVARELGEFSLMFLTHPSQSDEDVERVCEIVATVMSEAAR
jgi:dTDP-4-amino-4,6-dideoxygalactose transaminase